MMSARSSALLAASVLLSGCVSVGMNQLGTVQRLLPVRAAASAEADPQPWNLSFAGGTYTVFADKTAGGRLIFGSNDGLRAQWDGQSVIRLEGLPGAVGLLETGVEGGERWYARDGGPTLRLRCRPPDVWRSGDGRSGWRISCGASIGGRMVSALHAVEVDAMGQLLSIEATVVPGLAPLIVRRK